VSAEALQVAVEEPPIQEEQIVEQPVRLESIQRASPVMVGSLRNSDTHLSANATKWLATQISEFGGQENDNVKLWVRKVDKVARIHGAFDAVTLLAASSKLVKSAKQWYDLQDGPSNESWECLKRELTKMFDKKIPFFKVMQRVEARKWQTAKETFINMC